MKLNEAEKEVISIETAKPTTAQASNTLAVSIEIMKEGTKARKAGLGLSFLAGKLSTLSSPDRSKQRIGKQSGVGGRGGRTVTLVWAYFDRCKLPTLSYWELAIFTVSKEINVHRHYLAAVHVNAFTVSFLQIGLIM